MIATSNLIPKDAPEWAPRPEILKVRFKRDWQEWESGKEQGFFDQGAPLSMIDQKIAEPADEATAKYYTWRKWLESDNGRKWQKTEEHGQWKRERLIRESAAGDGIETAALDANGKRVRKKRGR